jgi:hypothetical protein
MITLDLLFSYWIIVWFVLYYFHIIQYNPKWIFIPETNISIALNTLGNLKKTCKYTKDNLYVLCYNRGIRGVYNIKKPANQIYYKKFNLIWN